MQIMMGGKELPTRALQGFFSGIRVNGSGAFFLSRTARPNRGLQWAGFAMRGY